MNPSLSPTPAEAQSRSIEARRLADHARALEREGNAREALVEYDLALALLERQRPSSQHADILRWKGTLLRELGQLAAADPVYARSLDMSRRLPYAGGIANALNCQAIVAQRRGDAKVARRLFAEAGLNAVHAGERRLFGIIEQNLGALAMVQGDLKDARARFKVSLRGFRDAQDDEGACWVLCNLSRLHALAGEMDDAGRLSEEALALAHRIGHAALEGVVELSRVEPLLALGRAAEAEGACRRGLAMADRRGDRVHRAESMRLLAAIARERGELESAARSLEEAGRLARESEHALLAAEVDRDAGDLWLRRGERDAARMAWELALGRFRALGASRDASALEARLAGAGA
jgi:ATP/maltotriose-dependent transcriptional regulator MalT